MDLHYFVQTFLVLANLKKENINRQSVSLATLFIIIVVLQ